MFQYSGKTALITGASSGIGREFAIALANRGMSLILVARSEEILRDLASELTTRNSTRVEVIVADLSRAEAVPQIAEAVGKAGLAVDLLINNAGFLTHGHFDKIDAQREHEEIMVNVASLVGLSHAFLPGMLDRRAGGIINVASIAGFQPIPYMATYAATKAFVISFSIALWEECRTKNVSVQALCPGTTTTNLFEAAQAPQAALGTPRTAVQVVASSLKGLDKNKSLVVDGTKNSLLCHGPRLIPKWFAARCAGQAVKPR